MQSADYGQAMEAARRWISEHGRWPAAGEWGRATAEHRSRRTYVGCFGSWEAAIEAAGELSKAHSPFGELGGTLGLDPNASFRCTHVGCTMVANGRGVSS
jgi:hypothetical protein